MQSNRLEQSHYQKLQIDQNATRMAILEAYQRLVSKNLPDPEVVEAFLTLIDPKQRTQYDLERKEQEYSHTQHWLQRITCPFQSEKGFQEAQSAFITAGSTILPPEFLYVGIPSREISGFHITKITNDDVICESTDPDIYKVEKSSAGVFWRKEQDLSFFKKQKFKKELELLTYAEDVSMAFLSERINSYLDCLFQAGERYHIVFGAFVCTIEEDARAFPGDYIIAKIPYINPLNLCSSPITEANILKIAHKDSEFIDTPKIINLGASTITIGGSTMSF